MFVFVLFILLVINCWSIDIVLLVVVIVGFVNVLVNELLVWFILENNKLLKMLVLLDCNEVVSYVFYLVGFLGVCFFEKFLVDIVI